MNRKLETVEKIFMLMHFVHLLSIKHIASSGACNVPIVASATANLPDIICFLIFQ